MAVALLALIAVSASAPRPEKEVLIAVTSNVQGLLTTCGTCDYVKVGGMAQKAVMLQNWRRQAKGALIVLDSGDAINFGDGGRSMPIMLRAMEMCGYAFSNVGDGDSAYGLAALRAAARGLKLRLLSTNMLDASTGKPAFLTAGRLQANGVRIGILGILDDSAVQGGYKGAGDYRLQDPVDSISRTLASSGIKRWADIVVLLAHAPSEKITLIAEKVPEIDLVVGGSEHARPPEPKLLDGAVYIRPHRYQVGLVRFAVHPKTGPKPVSWKLFTVLKSAPKDPRVEAIISRGLKHESDSPPPRVGQAAPEIVLPSENGGLRRLSEFRGRKVVLGFFDFCQACLATARKLSRLPGKPAVIGLVPFGKKDMRDFRRATGADMLFLRDENGAAAARYGAARCPSLFVVSGKGELLYASRSFDPSAPGAVRGILEKAAP
jgi:peroxiredoxin